MIEFLLLLYAVSFFLSAFLQYEMLLSFASAVAVHEIGHMMTARLLSVRYSRPELIGADARIYLGNLSCVFHEVCIVMAGPLTNIVASLVSLLFFPSRLFLFASLSFTMGVINLFPISHLDGGRLLSITLALCPIKRVSAILDLISVICSLSLVLFTAYRMLRYGDSFLSFAAVWYWFSKNLTKREKGSHREDLKE